ncbi:hypothetical protein [Lysobacter sp. FW306-1B-D06B]|uniref:hypothetical protein n=1 Tax=Lysobacter sp. FW306-1B-D06B TaxID=3140250 RepID=UPI0031405933
MIARSTMRGLAATLLLLMLTKTAPASAQSSSRIAALEAEGYELVGDARVERWLDHNGDEVGGGCPRYGQMELSNGLLLKCTGSGMSPGRDATVLRKGDYYKVLVGSDTYDAHN